MIFTYLTASRRSVVLQNWIYNALCGYYCSVQKHLINIPLNYVKLYASDLIQVPF
jgi:hypothetical protein